MLGMQTLEPFPQHDQQMNMVGHNYIFIQDNTAVHCGDVIYVVFYNAAYFTKANTGPGGRICRRNDFCQKGLAVFCADRNMIAATLAVIVVF